jgi:uncharacterized phiE125 gp8 family phage protein
MGTITVITAPTIEPVSLSEAKDMLRVTNVDDDGRIGKLIRTAREWAEHFCDIYIMTQTLERSYDTWPSTIIELNVSPIASITSIKYDDTGSPVTEQTLVVDTDYYADTTTDGGRVGTITGWPSHAIKFNPIRIRVVAGYTTQALVPERIKDGIKAYIVYLYDNDPDMKTMAENILWSERRI